MPGTVAVTGATGFIGRALVARLSAAGWSVRALVRPAHSAVRSGRGLEIVTGSLDDSPALDRLVAGTSAVVHCAGAVRGCCPGDFDPVNVEGVRHLVAAVLRQPRPSRLLSLSSLAAREPHLSDYAASKRGGEEVLVGTAGDLEWMALRPPAVYGPGDRELLPLFQWMGRGLVPLAGAPGARLSLLYVDDLVSAVLRWLEAGSCSSGIYEISDGQAGGYDWDEIIDRVAVLRARRVTRVPLSGSVLRALAGMNLIGARLFGYLPMLTPGKVRELRHPDWVGDSAPLRAEIGWAPQFTLEHGLRLTMGWGQAGSTDTPG